MSAEDKIEALVEAANARGVDSARREPRSLSWGTYSHADAPAAISREIGAFSWLDKKTDILKFVDPLVVADWARTVLGQLRSGDLEKGRTRRRLNTILHTYSQIKWTFKTGVVIKLKGTKCQVWN